MRFNVRDPVHVIALIGTILLVVIVLQFLWSFAQSLVS
jgi:hypothetical protein